MKYAKSWPRSWHSPLDTLEVVATLKALGADHLVRGSTSEGHRSTQGPVEAGVSVRVLGMLNSQVEENTSEPRTAKRMLVAVCQSTAELRRLTERCACRMEGCSCESVPARICIEVRKLTCS